MSKKNNKYFSLKRYLYLGIAAIAIILLIWYIISWHNVKQTEKYLNSYLIKTNTIQYEIDDISEIIQVLKESPSEYFIYISHTEDENIYKLEKKLKKIIDEYNINEAFYYININNYLDGNDIYSRLNEIFNTSKITNNPCILYYKNNEFNSIIINEKGIFDYNDFIKLLTENDYEK